MRPKMYAFRQAIKSVKLMFRATRLKTLFDGFECSLLHPFSIYWFSYYKSALQRHMLFHFHIPLYPLECQNLSSASCIYQLKQNNSPTIIPHLIYTKKVNLPQWESHKVVPFMSISRVIYSRSENRHGQRGTINFCKGPYFKAIWPY